MWLDRIVRAEDVRDVVSLGMIEIHDARVAPVGDVSPLSDEIESTCRRLARELAGQTPAEIGLTRAARELYRSVGIDPTKHRPSSEALLRRALRGKPFPRVSLPVDLANLWALSSGLPVGLYDLAKIEGERIEVRLGRSGESYAGIRKPDVRVEGRLVLADAAGPFGNPTSDSVRTAVTESSHDLLYVLIAPTSTEITFLDEWVAWLGERAALHLGAAPLSRVLP